MNFPSVSPEEFTRLQPFLILGERLGEFLAQMNEGRGHSLGVRYYGELADGRNDMLVNAVLVGLFKPILSSTVTPVNARQVAADRGIDIVESRSSRPRNFTSLISVKLLTDKSELWVEGAVFDGLAPRLVLVDGIGVDAPLAGTLIVLRNEDLPGVIGDVGSLLGRHRVNIANFALGRDGRRAIGVVNVDEREDIAPALLDELRGVKAVQDAHLVRVSAKE